MSEKKNLLFSKRETVDKSTSMGQETQTNQGLLGNPQNNQDSTNKKKKKKTTNKMQRMTPITKIKLKEHQMAI